MASMKRFKTKYAGVFYIEGTAANGKKPERIYYIRYRKDGKLVEEKAGRQHQDDMTAAKASGLRSDKIEGRQQSNRERRRAAEEVSSRWTIGQLWEIYRAKLFNSGATRTDSGRYENHLKQLFGDKEPHELAKLDIDRIRISLLKTHSPQTVKHVLTLLKRIINYGCGLGVIAPLSFKIEMPPVDNIKTEDLSHEQLQRLFEVLEASRHVMAANMMKLALYTGMRRGELFKLAWNDIDFERGFIHIREPKGGKSQKIPLNSSARKLLQSIPKQGSEYIFSARNGGPCKDIAKEVRAIKEAAGLPEDFRPLHGLRHVYATMLANSGKVDMFTLQKLMTHKSPQMTQRYAHYRDEAMQRAANEVSGILEDALSVRSDDKGAN
ncbi:MAG: Site-specific recombinase XerD [Candidatus Electronema aureum]|uniref:Site-specific recombinase XerD n=1 Tax=Candidatus Electronema aureum TaxID=2005002 RepID=A0A521G5K7_9BACT|nr:MAG: Site-specific recombinase XerD [Candidatus Electronema aureum]